MQVELLKTHTHAGILHMPLAVIALDDDLAQWLIGSGIARVIAKQASVEPDNKPIFRHEEKSK